MGNQQAIVENKIQKQPDESLSSLEIKWLPLNVYIFKSFPQRVWIKHDTFKPTSHHNHHTRPF